MTDGGDSGRVREYGAGIPDERRSRPTQPRRPRGGREQDDWAAFRLSGQRRNHNDVEENDVEESRQGKASRKPVTHYLIRMTLSRGTSASGSAKPWPSLKSRVKPAAPALCCARTYIPDPARSVSLRFTTSPGPEAGASGKFSGMLFGAGQRALSVR